MSEGSDHLRWVTELDRLELDVIRAERMLEDLSRKGPEAWVPPAGLVGAIPEDLRERAISLADRQQQVQAVMATMLGALRRQHEFADRVDRATGNAGAPVYLDVTA